MMTQNETIGRSKGFAGLSPMTIVNYITSLLAQLVIFKKAARFYAFLLDETVTPEQAVYYFYAQMLFLLMILPINYGGGWRVCMLALLGICVRAAMGDHFAEKD